MAFNPSLLQSLIGAESPQSGALAGAESSSSPHRSPTGPRVTGALARLSGSVHRALTEERPSGPARPRARSSPKPDLKDAVYGMPADKRAVEAVMDAYAYWTIDGVPGLTESEAKDFVRAWIEREEFDPLLTSLVHRQFSARLEELQAAPEAASDPVTAVETTAPQVLVRTSGEDGSDDELISVESQHQYHHDHHHQQQQQVGQQQQQTQQQQQQQPQPRPYIQGVWLADILAPAIDYWNKHRPEAALTAELAELQADVASLDPPRRRRRAELLRWSDAYRTRLTERAARFEQRAQSCLDGRRVQMQLAALACADEFVVPLAPDVVLVEPQVDVAAIDDMLAKYERRAAERERRQREEEQRIAERVAALTPSPPPPPPPPVTPPPSADSPTPDGQRTRAGASLYRTGSSSSSRRTLIQVVHGGDGFRSASPTGGGSRPRTPGTPAGSRPGSSLQ